MKNENTTRTTVVMDKELMKSLKKIAIDKEVTQNQLINAYIKGGISNNEKKSLKREDMLSTTFDKINPKLLKIINKIAKKENTSKTKTLEDIIERGIKNRKNNPPIDERIKKLSNGKIKVMNKSTYNPNDEDTKKMIGIFKAKEPFDSVEEVKKMERGEEI